MAAGPAVACRPPQTDLPGAAPTAPVASPVGMDWLDDLIEWLCYIYRLMGGDCDNLPPDAYPAMATVTEQYNTVGAPVLPTPAQYAQARNAVEQVWALTSPSLAGTGPTVTAFRAAMQSLYADLGGNPAEL